MPGKNKAVKAYAPIVSSLFIMVLTCLSSFQRVSASVKSYQKDRDGVSFLLDKGIMKVKICKDDII
jgi:alpha-D-xyloside xylohydrolase